MENEIVHMTMGIIGAAMFTTGVLMPNNPPNVFWMGTLVSVIGGGIMGLGLVMVFF